MPFNGSGTYTLPGAALADGQTVSATEHNTLRNDMATALTTCLTRDGQSPATANLPMGGFKFTGLAAGSGAGESVRYEQFASPPAIGGTTPAAGTFTTIIADNTAIVNDFRLSLTPNVPVTSSDVTGATSIHFLFYKGNRISLRVDGKYVTRTSGELSIVLGTLTANRPYDIFCYDNAGVPTLEILAWTSDTARATGVVIDASGVYVKTGDPNRRYIGSFYTTSTTTTEDSYAKRLLFNAYNQVRRPMRKTDSTFSWTYTTVTYRYANNSAANRLEYMAGLPGLAADIKCSGRSANSTGDISMITAIGFDSGTEAATGGSIAQMTSGANAYITGVAQFNTTLTPGFHFFSWLEHSAATGTTTWASNSNNGIHGEVMA